MSKKTYWIAGSLALALVAGIGVAQAHAERGFGHGGHSGEGWKQADANGDGRFNAADVEGALDAL